ncbi:MAG: PLP-dependent transferase [Bacteroidia bacterium]
MDLSYLINHYGEERDQYFNSVAPPIIQASNFVFDSVEAMRASLADEMDVPFYTRGHNPTVAILRKKLAALEGAEGALCSVVGLRFCRIMSSVQAGRSYSFGTKTLFLDRKVTGRLFAQIWCSGNND